MHIVHRDRLRVQLGNVIATRSRPRHLGTADRCTAGFQSGLCRLWVDSVEKVSEKELWN
jgi:hypothetical protein